MEHRFPLAYGSWTRSEIIGLPRKQSPDRPGSCFGIWRFEWPADRATLVADVASKVKKKRAGKEDIMLTRRVILSSLPPLPPPGCAERLGPVLSDPLDQDDPAYPRAGRPDVTARMIAEQLSSALGPPSSSRTVRWRPAALSAPRWSRTARGMLYAPLQARRPLSRRPIYKNVGYYPASLAPTQRFFSRQMLAVNPAVPVKSMR